MSVVSVALTGHLNLHPCRVRRFTSVDEFYGDIDLGLGVFVRRRIRVADAAGFATDKVALDALNAAVADAVLIVGVSGVGHVHDPLHLPVFIPGKSAGSRTPFPAILARAASDPGGFPKNIRRAVMEASR